MKKDENSLSDLIDEYEGQLRVIREILSRKREELRKTYPYSKKAFNLKNDVVAYRNIEHSLILSINHMRQYYNKEKKHYENKGCFEKRNS